MNRSNILQVEDDDNDVFLLKHAFEKAGITNRLTVARDGEEALEYLSGDGEFSDRNHFPLPHLILLDLKMPRRNGLDFLNWLRNESALPHLPVLVLSSSAQPGDIGRAYELGVNAFLVKPGTNSERIRMAAAIKEFWLELNMPPPGSLEA